MTEASLGMLFCLAFVTDNKQARLVSANPNLVKFLLEEKET